MAETGARFPREARLLRPAEFRALFRDSRRSVDPSFTVLCRRGAQPQARLGMAISKKTLQRAVERNLVKRLVRDSFRHRRSELAGIDVVVLSRRGIRTDDRAALRAALERHWERVARICG